jgi:hypothetical protein
MAADFQWAVTFVVMNIFSISLLHYVCVENGKKLWKMIFSFWHFASFAESILKNQVGCKKYILIFSSQF